MEINLLVRKKGIITSDNGVLIEADQFEYYKKQNLLNASGNVVIHDQVNNYFIYSNKITYDKNKDLIITKDNSKAVSIDDKNTIEANNFKYNQN